MHLPSETETNIQQSGFITKPNSNDSAEGTSTNEEECNGQCKCC